jgi:hypothetical protein
MLGLAPAPAETAAPQLLRSVGQSRHLLMGLGHHRGLSFVGGMPEGDNTGVGGIALGCAYPLRLPTAQSASSGGAVGLCAALEAQDACGGTAASFHTR